MRKLSIPPKLKSVPAFKQPRRTRRRTGGSQFSWSPGSFEEAKRDIALARLRSGERGAELATIMPHVIAWMGQQTALGGLECPSPASDPNGTYRVGIDPAGRPEIQRRSADGRWITVMP